MPTELDDDIKPIYDAFVSYASADRVLAKKVQAFFQSYRHKGSKSGLVVYLDQTDIRGGDLAIELAQALRRSSALIVCCSSDAADSRWVNKEVEDFVRMNPDKPVVPLILSGIPEDVLPAVVKAKDARFHDLRGAWRFGVLVPSARIELLRALAIVSGRHLRELIDWNRRRVILRGTFGVVGLGAVIGSATYYVNNQRLAKVTDLKATVRYRLFDDPGLGGGETLANWYKDNCTLHIGAYLDGDIPAANAIWPWQTAQFPRKNNAIHLQSNLQAMTTDRRISTAGTWIESVRIFTAFAGELGDLQQTKNWKFVRFEGRLSAVEPKQESALKRDDIPAKELFTRFAKYYRIDKKQVEQLSDVDSFLYPIPIVAELTLELNGTTVFFSQGLPARVTEGDGDARRIHITHFPFGQNESKPEAI
jgi:TIR domain